MTIEQRKKEPLTGESYEVLMREIGDYLGASL